MYFSKNDEKLMQLALIEANKSGACGEVPVGAIITKGNIILSAAGNNPIGDTDPTAHAEIKAIRAASLKLDNYRLMDTTLYVTLEPCLMCMGAIIHSRINRLVFGAHDPKTGAAVSRYRIGTDNLLNHSLHIEGGLLEKQCSTILRDFFKQKRR